MHTPHLHFDFYSYSHSDFYNINAEWSVLSGRDKFGVEVGVGINIHISWAHSAPKPFTFSSICKQSNNSKEAMLMPFCLWHCFLNVFFVCMRWQGRVTLAQMNGVTLTLFSWKQPHTTAQQHCQKMHRGKQFGNFVTCPKVFYKVGLKVIFDAVTL